MDGLSASVEATIEDRVGKISAATHEIKSIVDDYRMQAVGGNNGSLGPVEPGSGTQSDQ